MSSASAQRLARSECGGVANPGRAHARIASLLLLPLLLLLLLLPLPLLLLLLLLPWLPRFANAPPARTAATAWSSREAGARAKHAAGASEAAARQRPTATQSAHLASG